MTRETIQAADGRMYEIEYEGYLPPEQRAQIMSQMGCSTCGSRSISSLAPTCTATSKVVGQMVRLTSAPTGLGPFTVIFKKDGTQIGTTQTVPVASRTIYDYPTVTADTTTGTPVGTHAFSVETTSSCTGDTPCIESCSVSVLVPVLTTITVPNKTVATRNTVTMTKTCQDQAGQTITCPTVTWSTSSTLVTVNATTGVVTAGITTGTAVIRATDPVSLKYGEGTVTIGAQTLASITLAPVNPTINVGSTVTLTATCKDAALVVLPCPALTWTTSASAVATVVNGVVTGVAIGSATITATSGTISDSEIVTVTCAPTTCGFSVT